MKHEDVTNFLHNPPTYMQIIDAAILITVVVVYLIDLGMLYKLIKTRSEFADAVFNKTSTGIDVIEFTDFQMVQTPKDSTRFRRDVIHKDALKMTKKTLFSGYLFSLYGAVIFYEGTFIVMMVTFSMELGYLWFGKDQGKSFRRYFKWYHQKKEKIQVLDQKTTDVISEHNQQLETLENMSVIANSGHGKNITYIKATKENL